MSAPILATKLYIPQPRPHAVLRPRLIERLNMGLHRKLTLISAPAGFGKTTLASKWVAESMRAAAWLSLDERDSDLTRFLIYIVAAIRAAAPGDEEESDNEGGDPIGIGDSFGTMADFGEGVLGLLQNPQPPPTESILTALLNEISGIPVNFTFVLDDYHIIESTAIDGALDFLLEHMPPQMHLVIATREDPSLPLARYRASDQLTELRADDLRFSKAEAAIFLNQMMGLKLPADAIAALETRTEGWAAGLQMAALSMQGRADSSSFIEAFSGSHHFVLDYLVEEVLEQQPASIQDFLLQTAVLERMSGSLCDAVTGQDDGQATLEMLERSNLFIIPLDNERRWYRYHHLFADLLRQRLQRTYVNQIWLLHSRASEWYEQRGLPSEAIRHAIAAGDLARAADLAELAWPAMSRGYQSMVWLGWVKGLPEELVRARPVLCVSFAWAFLNSGDLEAAEARLSDGERWLQPLSEMDEGPEARPAGMIVVDEEQFQSLAVRLASARAYHAQATGDVSGTVTYAQKVIDLVAEDEQQWRGAALSLLGLAQYASGNLEEALQALSEGFGGMDPLEAVTGTFVLADIKMAQGQLRAAASHYERSLQLVLAQGEPLPLGTEDVYTGLSKVHREWGDLETAAQDLQISKKLGEQIELPDWRHRWCMAQARLYESQGDLAGALELLDEAERVYVRTPVPELRPIAAMRSRVWIKQGQIREALRWAVERNVSSDDALSFLREFEQITLARALIGRYRIDAVDEDVAEAKGLLERLLQEAVAGKRIGSVIEIVMLQALAEQAKGDIRSAVGYLERALRLGEQEGYVRMFVDEGRPMAQLLTEAASRKILTAYCGRLLLAFGVEEQKDEEPSFDPSAQTVQPLIEPLSKRELEVLRLISEGLSNREIAERLFLALNTVKGHNRNIFEKLQVHRRTEAVARARTLGLLS